MNIALRANVDLNTLVKIVFRMKKEAMDLPSM